MGKRKGKNNDYASVSSILTRSKLALSEQVPLEGKGKPSTPPSPVTATTKREKQKRSFENSLGEGIPSKTEESPIKPLSNRTIAVDDDDDDDDENVDQFFLNASQLKFSDYRKSLLFRSIIMMSKIEEIKTILNCQNELDFIKVAQSMLKIVDCENRLFAISPRIADITFSELKDLLDGARVSHSINKDFYSTYSTRRLTSAYSQSLSSKSKSAAILNPQGCSGSKTRIKQKLAEGNTISLEEINFNLAKVNRDFNEIFSYQDDVDNLNSALTTIHRYWLWRLWKQQKISEVDDVQSWLYKFFTLLFQDVPGVLISSGQGKKLRGEIFAKGIVTAETDLIICLTQTNSSSTSTHFSGLFTHSPLLVELKSTFGKLANDTAFPQRDQLLCQMELLYQTTKRRSLIGLLCDGIAFAFLFRFERPTGPCYYYTTRYTSPDVVIPLLCFIKRVVILIANGDDENAFARLESRTFVGAVTQLTELDCDADNAELLWEVEEQETGEEKQQRLSKRKKKQMRLDRDDRQRKNDSDVSDEERGKAGDGSDPSQPAKKRQKALETKKTNGETKAGSNTRNNSRHNNRSLASYELIMDEKENLHTNLLLANPKKQSPCKSKKVKALLQCYEDVDQEVIIDPLLLASLHDEAENLCPEIIDNPDFSTPLIADWQLMKVFHQHWYDLNDLQLTWEIKELRERQQRKEDQLSIFESFQ